MLPPRRTLIASATQSTIDNVQSTGQWPRQTRRTRTLDATHVLAACKSLQAMLHYYCARSITFNYISNIFEKYIKDHRSHRLHVSTSLLRWLFVAPDQRRPPIDRVLDKDAGNLYPSTLAAAWSGVEDVQRTFVSACLHS
jgi:hypothetical protein